MGKLNVAIADDNQLTLDLLGDIVSSDSELQVVGTAKDGESAYRLIKETTGCRIVGYCHAKARWTWRIRQNSFGSGGKKSTQCADGKCCRQ